MDFSKFKTSTWLMAGGAVGMIIGGLFLDWISIDFMGESFSDGNAFDWNRGTIAWILVVAVGVYGVLSVAGKVPASKAPLGLISVAGTLLSLLLLLSLLVFEDMFGASWGLGYWVSLIATGATTAGAVMEHTSSGGSIKDIIDPNKWKGA